MRMTRLMNRRIGMAVAAVWLLVVGKKVAWSRADNGSWGCATDADAQFAPPECPHGSIPALP